MKKLLFIGLPILLIGAVVGLGLMGIINIPGLTPKKKKGANLYAAEKMYGEQKDEAAKKPVIAKAAPPKKKPDPPKPELPKPDPIKGAKRVAKLWNTMEPAKVVEIAKDWRDQEFALVLSQMELERASEVLSALEPSRASKLSREIQRIAAQPVAVAN